VTAGGLCLSLINFLIVGASLNLTVTDICANGPVVVLVNVAESNEGRMQNLSYTFQSF